MFIHWLFVNCESIVWLSIVIQCRQHTVVSQTSTDNKSCHSLHWDLDNKDKVLNFSFSTKKKIKFWRIFHQLWSCFSLLGHRLSHNPLLFLLLASEAGLANQRSENGDWRGFGWTNYRGDGWNHPYKQPSH